MSEDETTQSEPRRANFIPPRAFHELDMACAEINRAYEQHGYGCFLVGSSTERRDWRDVDVRLMLEDAEYDRLYAGNDALWSLTCTTIAAWLSQRSGLPVDFQIQRASHANAKHPGAGRRSALGCFLRYPGELPSLVAAETAAPGRAGEEPGR